MNSNRLFRLLFFIGIGAYLLLVAWIVWNYYLGKEVSWFYFLQQSLPAAVLMLIGLLGPGLGLHKEQLPDPGICPHCGLLTDKNPCSHCGEDILEENEFLKKSRSLKKNKDLWQQNKKKYYLRFSVRTIILLTMLGAMLLVLLILYFQ